MLKKLPFGSFRQVKLCTGYRGTVHPFSKSAGVEAYGKAVSGRPFQLLFPVRVCRLGQRILCNLDFNIDKELKEMGW